MYLTVDDGSSAGSRIALTREQAITIGRHPDCTVVLEDGGVAEQHAVIKPLKGAGFGIKALADGVLVNGQPIQAARLSEGDFVECGGVRMRVDDGKTQPAQRTAVETKHLAVKPTRKSPSQEPRDTLPEAGRRLGGFRILGVLGKGGMGTVFRAEQISLDREVALKVLSDERKADPVFVERFLAEAQAAARLHHPNVVPVFDVDEDEGEYFYSMELMHGGSLEDLLRKEGRMPVERAIEVVRDAASGLAYAESLGIVHRDIKPDNLMLDRHGSVKIADLGLAATDAAAGGKLAGTPHFMSPEQALRKKLDHRSDLYSLGCTFYRLVTGATPFRGATVKDILKAQIKEEHEPAHKVESGIPNEVSAIIDTLLEKDPEDRYSTTAALIEDLNEQMAPVARRTAAWSLAALGILVAGGAVLWATLRETPEPVDPETIVIENEDPEQAAALRESNADRARLAVLAGSSSGLDRADALDAVAKEHADTEAAKSAATMAGEIREEVAATAAAETARTKRVQTAIQNLTEQVEAALIVATPAGLTPDWNAISTAITAADLGKETATDPQFVQAKTNATKRVQEFVAANLDQLRSEITRATTARDPDAMRTAAAALLRVTEGEAAWPETYLTDRPASAQTARDAGAAADALVATLANEQLTAAWGRLDEVTAADVAKQIQAAEFADAAATLRRFAEGVEVEAIVNRARNFAAALEFTSRAQLALTAALTLLPENSTPLQMMHEDKPGTVVGFSTEEGSNGSVLWRAASAKRSDEPTPLKLDELSFAQWKALLETFASDPKASIDPLAREALLVFRALIIETKLATDYLGGLDAEALQKASATPIDGTPTSTMGATAIDWEVLVADFARTAGANLPDWAALLLDEARAGALLVRGLRAFNEERDLAAATSLEQLFQDFPHSYAVVTTR